MRLWQAHPPQGLACSPCLARLALRKMARTVPWDVGSASGTRPPRGEVRPIAAVSGWVLPSMASAIGTLFVASEARIGAAGFGLVGHQALAGAAAHVTVRGGESGAAFPPAPRRATASFGFTVTSTVYAVQGQPRVGRSQG